MSVTIIDHPLVRHKPAPVHKADCSTYEFRTPTTGLARLMAYEASRDFSAEKYIIDGQCGQIEDGRIKDKTLTVVPILRAGLGMLDDVLDLIPTAKISMVDLQRNGETLKPVSYFKKFIDSMEKRLALIIDPMLATGGPMVATIDLLKAKGCRHIKALVLVAAPEGMKAVNEMHPDVTIYTAALDSHLNENGYIIPGPGDAGDKIFGTRQPPVPNRTGLKPTDTLFSDGLTLQGKTVNFQDGLSAMSGISHLSGLDALGAQGKVLHHIPTVQGRLGSFKFYNALMQEFDNRLDSTAAKRGLSLFAGHTVDTRANPGRHPNTDLLLKIKTENLVLQLRPVEARS